MCRIRGFTHSIHNLLRASLALSLAGVVATSVAPFSPLSPIGIAYAAHDSHSDTSHAGGHGSHGGHGSSGGHSGGHDDVVHDHTDGDDHGGGPGGRGGGRHGAHDGQGHGHDIARGGGRSVVSQIFRGRRPVWAQEGIPEVELGRLNVSRAPAHVLNRAEEEALSRYTTAMMALYSLSAEEAAEQLRLAYETTARLDSPLQNLAMYRDVMTFGKSELNGITPSSQYDLAAIFLGSASDKSIPVTRNTVIAVNRILGLQELPADDIAALASKAETVRSAIAIGHGDTGEH